MTLDLAKPAGPACARHGCGATPLVHWSRRHTPGELAAFAPETHTDDMRHLVYACGQHAISIDLAAHVHAANCSGPNSAQLPQCDCTPEPLPPGAADVPTVTLPTGWQVPAPTA